MYIAAIDPGKTTGVAFIDEEFDLDVHLLETKSRVELSKLLIEEKPKFIICESFRITRRSNSSSLVAVEMIGIVKLAADVVDALVIFQTPSYAKFWTAKKLSSIGLYRPGMPHAMDALRHLVQYVTNHKDDRWLDELRPE